MDILELIPKNAGPKTRGKIRDAADKIKIMRNRGLANDADVLEKSVADSLGSGDFNLFKGALGRVDEFYEKAPKPDTANYVPPEDPKKNSAATAASISAVNSLMDRSVRSGNTVGPELVKSIMALAEFDPDKALTLAQSSMPVLEEKKDSKKIALADQESALRAAGDASYAITALNDLSMAEGFPGVFGAGVGFKYIPGSKTRDAESMRESVVALSTTDSIRKFQGLGSMSDKEFSVAQSAATKLKDSGISEELAAQEINRLRSYFANSIRRAENLGKIPKGRSEQMIKDAMAELVAKQTPEASGDSEVTERPLTATERLHSLKK